jgi:2-polyprenyl-3-methyl-5-hydroxy-6-metoxy-1,4-benzoquinol methylase
MGRLPDRRLRSLYSDAPLLDRAHAMTRWATCPFDVVAAEVPSGGRVLDVGCGQGIFSLYLSLESAERSVLGVDVDERKVRIAQKAAERAARLGASVRFATVAPTEVPPGPWEAVVVVDELYLAPPEAQQSLVSGWICALAPGGKLIVKETATEAPKMRWTRLQETLAVRVLSISKGEGLNFVPPDRIVEWMRTAGLDVHERRADRGRVHPHHLIVGRRPEQG